MDAHELRLNNLIQWNDESEEIVSVNGIEHDEQGYWISTSAKEQAQIEEFIPIPLTEEWLINFGGSNMEYGYIFDFEPETCLLIVESNKEFYPELHQIIEHGLELDEIVTLKSIQYVHQLQNIYRALTGEELELKK